MGRTDGTGVGLSLALGWGASARATSGTVARPRRVRQARAGAARAGVELDLRLADMRDLDLTEPAALIYCPARALRVHHTPETHSVALDRNATEADGPLRGMGG